MKISGYLNILKSGGMLSTGLAIYDTENKAKTTGKITKGYVKTIHVDFEVPDNFLNEKVVK